MALLTEDFETGPPPTGWTTVSAMAFPGTGRTGNGVTLMAASGNGIQSPTFTLTVNTRSIFWVKATTIMAEEWLLRLINGASTNNASLKMNSGGTITIYDSNGSSVATTSETVPADSAWHSVTFDCESAGAGAYSLSIDGGTAITGTGDFTSTGSPGTDNVMLCGQTSSPYTYDDLSVDSIVAAGSPVTKRATSRSYVATTRSNFY